MAPCYTDYDGVLETPDVVSVKIFKVIGQIQFLCLNVLGVYLCMMLSFPPPFSTSNGSHFI